MKKFLKSCIPPIILTFIQGLKKDKYGWKGNYADWQSAKDASQGYDQDEIFSKVKASILKVKNGEAVYERDSVIFDKIQYSWPFLAGLMFAATKVGNLRVLDFGGSLGSSYFQNQKFFDKFDNVSWNIVEQEHFVKSGKQEFENDELHFYYDVDTCVKQQKTEILALSSVMQYLEKPYEMLDSILIHDFKFILVDRTPFSTQSRDVIKLQIVNPQIYNASYPCWLFETQKFNDYFVSKGYELIEEYDALGGQTQDYVFKGSIWKKNA
ncbi:MAG: methyltransferase, TIGR04325 family [Alphaproteobacteria bacterium]|nr:methyltransferase, TIGR04325 family [Alphaproteobacteria bacterium]